MPVESFLINPVRRRKTKKSLLSSLFGNPTRRRRKSSASKGLPSPLLKRMMKKYGPRQGMRHAWAEYKKGVRSNPFGEEVIVVGANPRRKKRITIRREVTKMARRKRRVKRNAFFGGRSKHRAAALKGWRGRRRLSANPRRRRRTSSIRRYASNRVRRYARRNPVRRYARRSSVRRYRRNPAAVASMGGISLSKPMSLVMPIAIGLAARIATQRAPIFLGMVAPLPRYGVQAAVAVGGGLLLNKFVGRTNAMVWTIVSGVTILESILNEFVFRTVAVSGMGAFPQSLSGVGYEEPEGMGAYPYEGQVQY